MNNKPKGEEEFDQLEFPFEDDDSDKNYFQDILSTEDCFPFDIKNED